MQKEKREKKLTQPPLPHTKPLRILADAEGLRPFSSTDFYLFLFLGSAHPIKEVHHLLQIRFRIHAHAVTSFGLT